MIDMYLKGQCWRLEKVSRNASYNPGYSTSWFPAASNFWNLMSSKSSSWGWGDIQLSSHPTSKPKSALLCVIVCQSVVSLCFRLVELELCSVVHISNPAVPTQKHQVGSNCSCQPALAVGPKKRSGHKGLKTELMRLRVWCQSNDMGYGNEKSRPPNWECSSF